MYHAVISDSEVEVITLGARLDPHPPTLLSAPNSTPRCQPSICRLETTHFIAVTRHDGAPWPHKTPPRLAARAPAPAQLRWRGEGGGGGGGMSDAWQVY